jgi:hypothetical protein
MDLECGKVPKVILTLVNGNSAKPMVMVLIHGLMVIDMRVNLKNASSTDKDYKSLPIATYTKALTLMESHQDTANTIG